MVAATDVSLHRVLPRHMSSWSVKVGLTKKDGPIGPSGDTELKLFYSEVSASYIAHHNGVVC
jgi:hypothetical protein